MSLPEWLKSQLTDRGIDLTAPDPYDDFTEVGLNLCVCRGEGCRTCDNTGVIYP
jgi:hypothetical protein